MTTTTTLQHRDDQAATRRGLDFPTIIGVAAALGAISALCEDATLQLVLWAFLN